MKIPRRRKGKEGARWRQSAGQGTECTSPEWQIKGKENEGEEKGENERGGRTRLECREEN